MRRGLMFFLAAGLSVGAVPVFPAHSAETATLTSDPVGDWIGTLDVGSPVRVAMHVKRVDGALVGTVDSPDQGMFGIAMSEVTEDGDHLNFQIELFDGNYTSTWNPAKQRYEGTWVQGGRMFALEFGRGKYPPPGPLPGH